MQGRLLQRVNWGAAVDEASRSAAAAPVVGEVLALSSLFASDFQTAMERLQQARKYEPLQPGHELRRALVLARFGDFAAASDRLDRLKQLLPDAPLIEYLRALVELRAGRPDKARAICASLETSHPTFVPAKFLRAESQILLGPRPRAAEKYLMALPTGPEWDAAWADLLVKLAMLYPQDGVTAARSYLDKKKITPGSAAQAAATQALAWAGATVDELAHHVGEQLPGSRSEAVILECLIDRLRPQDTDQAIRVVDALRRAHPQRTAVERVYHAFLTRRSAELSAAGRHEDALRLVERCVRHQPHDVIYHQNRAALFTLLREGRSYHDAWADLNRHCYRLALVGAWDSFTIAQIVKTHRLFAEQARGTTDGNDRTARGIFRLVEVEAGERLRVQVNSDGIAADPDLLRQWMHHSRAELVFRHAQLPSDRGALLLDPADRDHAAERAQALRTLTDSLVTLVADEGAQLADHLRILWTRAAAAVRTDYSALDERERAAGNADADKDGGAGGLAGSKVDALKQQHVQVLADLCLLCRQWRPEHRDMWIAEEVLVFTAAEAAFFDQGLVRRIERQSGYDMPDGIRHLTAQMSAVSGSGDTWLTPQQLTTVVRSCMGELLREMAESTYASHSGSAKESAERALPFIDRARQLSATDVDVELTAAKLFTLGEFFDDAGHALERFRRFVKPDNRGSIEAGEKISELLQTRRKDAGDGDGASGRKRDVGGAAAPERHDSRIAELEQELERCPAVWRLYEDLALELAKAGRFEDAVQWSDRAVAHCLNRADQMNARALAIAARGMKALAQDNPRAARLYAIGAHDPSRRALESLARHRQLDYTELYLLGHCQLIGGAPAEAQRSFAAAEQVCERQLHRTVLRHLANDIDHAYLDVARSAVTTALQEGAIQEAIQAAAAVFPGLRDPGAWLVDFARVFYHVSVSSVDDSRAAVTIPQITVRASWTAALASALAGDDNVERTLRILALSLDVHAPSERQARALIDRTHVLRRRILAAQTLRTAGELLKERRFNDVLTLTAADPGVQDEPRLLRVRALAFLGLQRFSDADAAVAAIGGAGAAEVREFVSQFASLAFRHRLVAAQRHLAQGKPADAGELLRAATPASRQDEIDLAYYRAFAATLEGHQLRRQGRHIDARSRFTTGLAAIEPYVRAGDTAQNVSELYDRLEKEVESYV